MKVRLVVCGCACWALALCGVTAGEMPVPAGGSNPSNSAPVLVSAAGAASAGGYTSPWVTEVTKLAQAGVDEGVLLAYIWNTEGTFNLNAEQMAALSDLGVSGEVLNAMNQHDQEVASGARVLKATTVPLSTNLVAALRNVRGAERVSAKPAPYESIIVRDDPPESELVAFSAEVETAQSKCAGKLYRVRKPYPVRLTDTIVVFRTEPRVSNLQIINPLDP